MIEKQLKKIQETKKALDQVSPTFCPVKWKHATINLGFGTVKSCCHQSFRNLESSTGNDDLQFHDTILDRQERQQLLDGARPKNCDSCWWLEDLGQLSDRVIWSSKSWMAPYIVEVAREPLDRAMAPAWVELNFSNSCNLKCSYCSPLYSTKWAQEIAEFGPYSTRPTHNNTKHLDGYTKTFTPDGRNQVLSQFWNWFEAHYSSIRVLKLTGGEPLLSEDSFRLFNLLKRQPNREMNIAVNSNASVPSTVFDRLLNFLKEADEVGIANKFCLHPSIDSFGSHAEYIRNGLDINLFKQNIESYLRHPKAHLVFICTINNLSLIRLRDLWAYVLDLKKRYGNSERTISISTEILMAPDWQNIDILPDSFQKYVGDTLEFVNQHLGPHFTQFTESEKMGLERVLATMKNSKKNDEKAQKNFYRFFSEHDRRRGTDFLATFPEMREFWTACKA